MSLLTIIQDAAEDLGITAPSSVIGSADRQVVQLLSLANREGRTLRDRYDWEYKFKEATFTTVATESQGAMTTVAGSDFHHIVNDTIWDRDTSEPISGPVSPQQWQSLQAFSVTGPYFQYRIRGGLLLFEPTPAAGINCAFEYMSDAFCESSGGTAQSAWAADDDTGLLDESIMTQGVIWRWLQRKGLDYAEDFTEYERRVADAMARDGGKPMLRLDGGRGERQPGIFVPQGSWNL